ALLDGQEDLLVEPQRIVSRHQTSRVDDLDRPVLGQLDRPRDAVAGDAGQIVDDRLPPPQQAVEQGRLADVGSADDGDGGGEGHGRNYPLQVSVPSGRPALRGLTPTPLHEWRGASLYSFPLSTKWRGGQGVRIRRAGRSEEHHST